MYKRCTKENINGEYFYSPVAATHIAKGHIYEVSDESVTQFRTNAGWHPKNCFEDVDIQLVCKFKPGDKVKCIEEYRYFDYYKGFRIETGKIYTITAISDIECGDSIDCSQNINDFYSFHFLVCLTEDYSNIQNETYYPEHYFELVNTNTN